jgi:hypothetical protein
VECERGEELNMLKISRGDDFGGGVTLRLEGKIVGPWVDELEAAWLAAEAPVLDLKEVEFVDREGIKLLGQLRSKGTQLRDCSEFLEQQLLTA